MKTKAGVKMTKSKNEDELEHEELARPIDLRSLDLGDFIPARLAWGSAGTFASYPYASRQGRRD